MGASPDRICTMINGCDTSVFHVRDRAQAREKLHIDPAAKAVVYIGRTDVNKGVRELVDAAVSLHPQHPDLHVYMIGGGPDAGNCSEQNRGPQRIQLHSCVACLCLRRCCCLDGCRRSGHAAELYGRLSQRRAGSAGLRPPCGGHQCRWHPRDHERRIWTPRACLAIQPRWPRPLRSVLAAHWDPAAIAAHMGRGWDTVSGELLALFESLVTKGRRQRMSARQAEAPPRHRRAQTRPMAQPSACGHWTHHGSGYLYAHRLVVGSSLLRPNRAAQRGCSHPSQRRRRRQQWHLLFLLLARPLCIGCMANGRL